MNLRAPFVGVRGRFAVGGAMVGFPVFDFDE